MLYSFAERTKEKGTDWMDYDYRTHGTCSRKIDFEVRDGRVYNVRFTGGCNGNTQGVSKLVEGMPVDDVIARLKGIRCGGKPTSCPDQLAAALEQAKARSQETD